MATPRPRRPRARRAVAAAALVLVAGTACDRTDPPDAASTTSGADTGLRAIHITPIGDAPALQLGDATKLPMVVNVWATWCGPCRKEMPAFESVATAHADAVRFVGINLGDAEEQARTFITDTGVTFDQYLDPDMSAQAALSIASMPATVFVRADGTIAATHNGALDAEGLEQQLSEQLGVS